jgi:HYR domain-containing protein
MSLPASSSRVRGQDPHRSYARRAPRADASPPHISLARKVLLYTLSGALWAATAFAANPAADLDQARNGTASSPTSPVNFQNGNAGSSNSHYIEGHSIAYRMLLTNLTTVAPADTHSVVIEWDIRHSSRNAIDFITYVDRLQPHTQFLPAHTQESVQPRFGLSTTFSDSMVFSIPPPPVSTVVMGVPQPTTQFGALPGAEKVMKIYNGTITYMKYVQNADNNFGDLSAAQSATRLRIGFTASSPTVLFAWGGHIGRGLDWGQGNSAGGISGSPYHTRVIALDGSSGNQDRSLSAGAVLTCLASGPDSPCAGTTQTYTANVITGATYAWSLPVNTSGASFAGATNTSTVMVNTGTGGSFTLRVVITTNDGSVSCDEVVTVDAGPVCSITGPNGPVCPTSGPYTYCGPVGMSSYAWSVSGDATIPGAKNGQCVDVQAATVCNGSYTLTLTITNGNGCPTTCTKTVSVRDETAPTISALPGPSAIQCPAAPSFATPTATDLCDASPTLTFADVTTPGSCPGTYRRIRTWTATDDCGNSSTASQTIDVIDTTAPTLSAAGPGGTLQCPLVPTFTPPTASDTCDPDPDVTVVSDVTTDGSCPGTYSRTITWHATDCAGNVSGPVSETWNVIDTTAPTITCPSHLTAGCSEVVNFTTSATDACDPNVTVTCDPPSGQVFPVGETTVTCTSTDACLNTRTCSFTVTVTPCAQGCTPGFWCGGVGRTLWNEPDDVQWGNACGGADPFLMTDTFCGAPLNLFDCHPDVKDSTMKALLCTGGGDIWAQKAARDVIAAYLNASCGGVAFGMTPQAVAQMWNDAVAGIISFETLHNTLGALNDPGTAGACPMGRVRVPVLVRSEAEGLPGSEGPGNSPFALDLYRPTPNPFRDATRLAYAVTAGEGERVEIGVYDIAGRRIRGLVNEIANPGRYETRWDGNSDAGVGVRNGLYFIHISIGEWRRTVHVTYLR